MYWNISGEFHQLTSNEHLMFLVSLSTGFRTTKHLVVYWTSTETAANYCCRRSWTPNFKLVSTTTTTGKSKNTTTVVSEKAISPKISPNRLPPSVQLPIVEHRRHCRESRFAPYPLPPQAPVSSSTALADMFKRGLPSSDTMANDQTATSPITRKPQPGCNLPFMQFSLQQPPSYSTFTPADYQHFPYTFSSSTPPAYSWANTNSTHVMKYVTVITQFIVRWPDVI